MSNATITRTESPGATIDCEQVVVSGNTVERVRTEITGTTPTAIVQPSNSDAPANSTAYGVQQRLVGRLAQSFCDGAFTVIPLDASSLSHTATQLTTGLTNVRKLQIVNGPTSSPIVVGGNNVAMVPGSNPVGIILASGESTGWLPINESAAIYAATDSTSGPFSIICITE